MDNVSLSYLLAHPTTLGLTVERPLLLLGLAGLAVFYRFPIAAIGGRAVALRSIAFACVIAAMAGVGLTTSLPANELSLVAAVDLSGSIDDAAVEWSQRYLNAIESSLAPGDQLDVVTFAKSPEIRSARISSDEMFDLTRPNDLAATDIGAAIDQALALYPQGTQKALLLISDGNETVGNSRDRIETLRALSVRVDAIAPPRTGGADVRVARLSAPRIVAPERPVPLRASIRNASGSSPALLNFYLDGRISDSIAVELSPGLNPFDVMLTIPEPGGHVIRAEIVTNEEERLEDNAREIAIFVRPATEILLATTRRYSPLTEVLRSRGLTVKKIPPDQLPTDVGGYSATHLVILEDLRGNQLSEQRAGALEDFVRIHGGGMIFAGGGATFGDKTLRDTPVAKMLPVTLEPRRPRPGKRDPLALFLVIDRSNSMGFNSRLSTLRDGEKLRYAIKAGVAVVKQLKDHDSVGVIAFDARPHEIAPLRPLKANREKLLAALPRIVESGGTDFYDALTSASEQLTHSRVSRKHIVLLTDGDTNRAGRGEYRALVKTLARSGISVTTIRIGDNTVNLKLLQNISEGTGGSFHHVENAQMLPDLMLRDTSRALRKLAPRTQTYLPAISTEHHLLTGTREDQIPHLADYAFSKPKPNSETLLHVARADRKDPILNVWRYGLGRVVAFTASPSDGAETWPAWSGFARFWSHLAFWSARSESAEDLSVESQRNYHSTMITARIFSAVPTATSISGQLDIGGDSIDLDFSASDSASFRTTTIPLPAGRYPLRIRRRQGDTVREIETVVAVPTQLQEETKEFAHSGDNEELLRELTVRTGGTLSPGVNDVTERPTGARTVSYPLVEWLIPLAILAFFADIALRRLASLRPESSTREASESPSTN